MDNYTKKLIKALESDIQEYKDAEKHWLDLTLKTKSFTVKSEAMRKASLCASEVFKLRRQLLDVENGGQQ